jgi:protein SCO1/2
LLAEKDPLAVELFTKFRSVRMPNLQLSSDEVAALLGYLEGETKAAADRGSAPIKNAAVP